MIPKDIYGPHKIIAELEFEPEFYLDQERDNETYKCVDEYLVKQLSKKISMPAWDDYYDDYAE